jgi:hypothetical protein
MAQAHKTVEAKAHTTKDHEAIRKWAEKRGGHPARVKGTNILRIDFGEPEPTLEQISWDEFFKIFDESDLDFLYQDKTADGKTSRFFKFVRSGDERAGDRK